MKALPIRRLAIITVMFLAVTACTLAAVACGGDETADLDGTSWVLVRWNDGDLDPGDFTITVDFEDGRIGGVAAVNTYGGPYETGSNGEFSIGPLSSTMHGAMGDEGRAERFFFDLLESAASYEVVGDTLTLFDEFGDEALVFTTAKE